MARTTFMAIHTYHDEKTKNEFLSDMPITERTDVEWKRIGAIGPSVILGYDRWGC